MNEEMIGRIFQMISAAGAARSKYMEAIAKAKEGQFQLAEADIKEGSEMFVEAHKVHAELLAAEAGGLEASGAQSNVSLILVHAEDQMMCAETFRLMAVEFIDLYKRI